MPAPDTQSNQPLSPGQQQILDALNGASTPPSLSASSLQPHQQRVVVERDELQDRNDKLMSFLHSPMATRVALEEIELMRLQARQQQDLLNTLNLRIKFWSTQ